MWLTMWLTMKLQHPKCDGKNLDVQHFRLSSNTDEYRFQRKNCLSQHTQIMSNEIVDKYTKEAILSGQNTYVEVINTEID